MALPDLAGAACFVLTSFFPGAAMRRRMQVAPNTVFGLAGVTFVNDDPLAAAGRWRSVLTPAPGRVPAGSGQVVHGVHRFTWLYPTDLTEGYGLRRQIGPPDIAVVHLLAEQPTVTAQMMAAAGWVVHERSHDIFVVEGHPADGINFTVTSGSADERRHQRATVLGEHLTVERFDRQTKPRR